MTTLAEQVYGRTAYAAAPWNGGGQIYLGPGGSASCGGLNPGQLYAVFLINAAGNDTNTTVNVVGSQAYPPTTVTVPGTTQGQGAAALVFLSGNDTNQVSISVPTAQGAQIEAFLGSVSMPINTQGLNNVLLPNNGQKFQFGGYQRFFAVPPASWQQLTITANGPNQFISVQFLENAATVNICNPLASTIANGGGSIVKTWGPSAVGKYTVVLGGQGSNPQPQTIQSTLQGTAMGAQYVWFPADSPQNTNGASISLQQM
jgi:hypothetical protein